MLFFTFFFFQAEDGIRDDLVTGVQTCALPIAGSAINTLLPELRKVDDALRRIAILEGVRYVSPISKLCEGDKCTIVLGSRGNRILLAYDNGHLTRGGSAFYTAAMIGPAIQTGPASTSQ